MPFDLDLLDPRSPNFFQLLRDSPDTVANRQRNDYFSVLLRLLESDSADVRLASIQALCDFLSLSSGNLSAARSGNFLRRIPRCEESLDLFHFLASCQSADVLNDGFQPLADLIADFPGPVLHVIAIYAKQFESIRNPWPVLDLLFRHSTAFCGRVTADNYVAVLGFMTRFDRFLSEKAQDAWDGVCRVLSVKNIALVSAAYGVLARIAVGAKRKIRNFPTEFAVGHLGKGLNSGDRFVGLVRSVVSLLLRVRPRAPPEDLISLLLTHGETNLRGTLVLMKLAEVEATSRILVRAMGWLSKGLPSMMDTIRLFCVVLCHTDLRPVVTAPPELPGFLKAVMDVADGLKLLSVILRRLALNEQFIKTLSDEGFFNAYFARALGDANAGTVQSGLIVVRLVAEICYIPDLDQAAGIVVDIVKGDTDGLTNAALNVTLPLCNHQKCVAVFQRRKFQAVLIRTEQNRKYRDWAEAFIDALDAAEEDE
jgi:hypothetical protein